MNPILSEIQGLLEGRAEGRYGTGLSGLPQTADLEQGTLPGGGHRHDPGRRAGTLSRIASNVVPVPAWSPTAG